MTARRVDSLLRRENERKEILMCWSISEYLSDKVTIVTAELRSIKLL